MNRASLIRSVPLALLVASLAPLAHAAPTYSQSFTLHPGWNAIYLEVAPPVADPATVFAGVPLMSVWTWNPKTTSAEFIQNPSEDAFTRAGWLGYFPVGGPFTSLTNLFAIQANRAYLVRISGVSNVPLTVNGRPSARATSWVPNSLNLTGFHVDPGSPPTFASFLASSPAHAGQAIYKLGLDGIWAPLPASTPINSGEAYWVFCSGASTFTAPAWADLELGDGLDYPQALAEINMTIRNSGAATVVSLTLSGNAPLAYWAISPVTLDAEWPALPSPLNVNVAAQDSTSLRVAAQRSALTGPSGEGIMEFRDGRGTRILIPVSEVQLAGVTRLLSPPTPLLFWAPAATSKTMPFDFRRRSDS